MENNEQLCPFRTVQNSEGIVRIFLGNELASKREFSSHEEAQDYIDNKPWDLLLILCCAVKGFNNVEQSKNEGK